MQVAVAARWIKEKATTVNLFESEEAHTNAFHLRTSIISTRVYIILLTFSITTLVVYNVLGTKIDSITIQNPPQAIYEDLLSKYPTTLSCRCSQTTIPYGTFISVSVRYHPICSSFFVSDTWINILFSQNISYYIQIDFRSSASGHFQLLSSLCSLANRSVNDALDDFISDTFFSLDVLSPQSLETKGQVYSSFIRTSVINAVHQILSIIRDTTYSNQLQPALQTNAIDTLYIYSDDSVASGSLDGCFYKDNNTACCCSTIANCSAPSGFFDVYAYETEGDFISPQPSKANVNGFVAGCYAFESLLQSTLECFFDEKCLETVLTFFPTNNETNIDILDANQTQFLPTTFILTIINELFIEQWSTMISFADYYKQCAPTSCTYTFIQRNNFLYVVTVLLGLYGGLTVVLRVCIPFVIGWWRKRSVRITEINPPIPLIVRLKAMWEQLQAKIIQFNLYKTHTRDIDPFELTTSIISTRIYVLLLCLCMIILIIFTWLEYQIYSVTVYNPSQITYEYLYDNYPNTLLCPCSQIVITQGSFLSLSPTYHPVCSSAYLSFDWIDSIEGTVNNDFSYSYTDFHVTGQIVFITISTLCSLAKSTLSDELYIFNQSTLITGQLLSNKELTIRSNTIFDQFESKTLAEFRRTLSIIQFHTQTMISTTRGNADLVTNEMINNDTQTEERIDFHSLPARYGNCVCALNDDCKQQMNMYSNGNSDVYELKFPIPNLYIGCFVVRSVLQSTLECFFNQTCLDAIQAEIVSTNSLNISILNANSTRFSPQTFIGTLVDELLVDQWGQTIQYDQYFAQCAPKLCSYTFSSRNNAIYVFTKLIGLLGGLTVALEFTVKIAVKWIRNRMKREVPINNVINHRMPNSCIHTFWHWIKTKVIEFNMFNNGMTWDHHHRRTQIITTRIYILLITFATIILMIYTAIELQTQVITVFNPSLPAFEQLQSDPRYSPTLECPCKNIDISYDTFISISPQFHQLCTSDFIVNSSLWMTHIFYREVSLDYSYDDFRVFIVPQFQLIVSLCTLANETFTNALNLYMSETLLSDQIQSRKTIETRANMSLIQFRLSTCRTFVRTLDYIRYINQGNAIVSSILSNWHFLSLDTSRSWTSLWAEPRSYGNNNCSCGTNSMCTSPAYIDEWLVPGFLIGCYPHEALFQSTLECFYDILCIDRLKTLYSPSNITFRPLNSTLSNADATVQSLVNILMIVEWKTNVVYEEYYRACAPLSCSYSINYHQNLLYIISTIIGLYGGLSVVLQVILPGSVRASRRWIMSRRQRVQPATTVWLT